MQIVRFLNHVLVTPIGVNILPCKLAKVKEKFPEN